MNKVFDYVLCLLGVGQVEIRSQLAEKKEDNPVEDEIPVGGGL